MFSPVASMMNALPSIGIDPSGIIMLPALGPEEGVDGITTGRPEVDEAPEGEAPEGEVPVIMLGDMPEGEEPVIMLGEAPEGEAPDIIGEDPDGAVALFMLKGAEGAEVGIGMPADGMLLLIAVGVAAAGIIPGIPVIMLESIDCIIGLPEASGIMLLIMLDIMPWTGIID